MAYLPGSLAVDFRDGFERAKAINLELRSRVVLAAGEVLTVSIFDGPIEGFGADISKLHKRIMEERCPCPLAELAAVLGPR